MEMSGFKPAAGVMTCHLVAAGSLAVVSLEGDISLSYLSHRLVTGKVVNTVRAGRLLSFL